MTPEQFQSNVTAWVSAIVAALTVLIGAGFTIYSLIRSKLADIEQRQNLHAQQIGAIALATPSPSQTTTNVGTVNEAPIPIAPSVLAANQRLDAEMQEQGHSVEPVALTGGSPE